MRSRLAQSQLVHFGFVDCGGSRQLLQQGCTHLALLLTCRAFIPAELLSGAVQVVGLNVVVMGSPCVDALSVPLVMAIGMRLRRGNAIPTAGQVAADREMSGRPSSNRHD